MADAMIARDFEVNQPQSSLLSDFEKDILLSLIKPHSITLPDIPEKYGFARQYINTIVSGRSLNR